MKITFKPLAYQKDAVQAVIDVFGGQERFAHHAYHVSDMTQKMTPPSGFAKQMDLGFNPDRQNHNAQIDIDEPIGFANAPLFDLNQILTNIQSVQTHQGLPKSDSLITADNKKGDNLTQSVLNLNIEMETGTGKTYTYLRTIFELNKQYGWSKFIIVVPSIAIREGVNKSIAMMADDLLAEYGKKSHVRLFMTLRRCTIWRVLA